MGAFAAAVAAATTRQLQGVGPRSSTAAGPVGRQATEWACALWSLQDAWVGGLQPNAEDYRLAISACEEGGQWRWALRLLLDMRERGLELSVATYNTVMSACTGGGQLEWVLALLDEMRGVQLAPDKATYSVAIRACQEGGDCTWSLALLDEMQQRGFGAEADLYQAAIEVCSRSEQWARSLAVLQEVQVQSVEPTATISYSVLRACQEASSAAAASAWEEGRPARALQALRGGRQGPARPPRGAAGPQGRGAPPKPEGAELSREFREAWWEAFGPATAARLVEVQELARTGRSEEALAAYRAAAAEGLCGFWRSDVALDLHGLPAAVARVTVRAAVAEVLERPRGLFFNVGHGHGSTGRAVLGHAVVGVLQKEFRLPAKKVSRLGR